MQISKILIDYIKATKTDYAIMIDGEWGAGKSWYWSNVLAKEIAKINTPDSTSDNPKFFKAVTLSLFGVSTPDELRTRIFEETNEIFKNKYVKTGAKLIGFGANMAANYFSIGDVKRHDVTEMFSEFSIDLSSFVLCFDDLERIKPSILLELLGYINTLIEQDNVKVVFICNENELKDEDYHKYKEKIVRFTHTIKADIGKMVVEFADNHKNKTYSEFLKKHSSYIASVYEKGECNNLRTLKFNIDIYERVFDIVRSTIQPYEENHVTEIATYMLLLSMLYSIEYRRDNDEHKLRSLSSITRSWSYGIDTLESLERSANTRQDQPKGKVKDEILEYQQSVRQRYFCNTYIYGSSETLIEYLLTGFLDEGRLRKEIQAIDKESQRYVTSEEKQLFESLSYFWDTNDEDMSMAVKRTLERVAEASFLLVDYPTFFLCLQRLQNFEFIDLGVPIADLHEMFADAISRCNHISYVEGINSYYFGCQDQGTPEFEDLVKRVKDKNEALYDTISLTKFETIVRDKKSVEKLNPYQGLDCNIFQNISADDFFKLFLQYSNRRKRDYWNFFEERYKSSICYSADKTFIIHLKTILGDYTTNPSTPITGTRKYCCKILELFDDKIHSHEPANR